MFITPIGFFGDVGELSLLATAGPNNNTTTLSITVPEGNNKVLFLATTGRGATISGASIPAGSLTKLVEQLNLCQSAMWFYVNPPTGTYDITVSSSDVNMYLYAEVLGGVHQTYPIYKYMHGSHTGSVDASTKIEEYNQNGREWYSYFCLGSRFGYGTGYVVSDGPTTLNNVLNTNINQIHVAEIGDYSTVNEYLKFIPHTANQMASVGAVIRPIGVGVSPVSVNSTEETAELPSGTLSTSITVPSDVDYVLVFGTINGTSQWFTAFTLDGNATDDWQDQIGNEGVAVALGGWNVTSSGSKTLACTISGTDADKIFYVVYLKNVKTANAKAGGDAQRNSDTFTPEVDTVGAGIVVTAGAHGANSSFSFASGMTELLDSTSSIGTRALGYRISNGYYESVEISSDRELTGVCMSLALEG